MQPPLSDADPSRWSLLSSYGTAADFSGSVAYESRASFDLNAPLTLEQTEALVDQLFQELIKGQECAPLETTTDSVGLNIDFGFPDVNTDDLNQGFCPLEYSPVLSSTHESTAENTLEPRTPLIPPTSHQDLSSSSSSSPPMSAPSSPFSCPSPASSSTSSSPPQSPPSYPPHSAGKRSVTQPSRNAQMPAHTKPQPARPNECGYCHCRFGRRADAARHEKTHFVREYQYACLGVPAEEGECDAADIANGFMHEGKLMVHGCLTTFKDRRDSYRRHLATRGCPGSKAGYWANMKEVEAVRTKRRANGY